MHNTEDGGRRFPSRRQFVTLGIGAFTVAVAPRLLRPERRLTRRTIPVMGTMADFAVIHRDERHAQGAIGAAIEALQQVEWAMTRFRADSDVGRANAAAARDAVRVSEDTALVVAEALRWANETEGAFDPAIGRLVAAWDAGRRSEPPPASVVRYFAARRLHQAVEVGRRGAHPVLRFRDADVALDLGGIAKGFGVDRAVAALRDWGVRDAIVNVGGDLFAMGVSVEGDPWRVGIRSPDDPATLSGTFEATDIAVATSGDYEQGFNYRGRRYHHLLDTRTAEPRTPVVHSLTVAADDCMRADAAATALFGVPGEVASGVLARVAPRSRIIQAG